MVYSFASTLALIACMLTTSAALFRGFEMHCSALIGTFRPPAFKNPGAHIVKHRPYVQDEMRRMRTILLVSVFVGILILQGGWISVAEGKKTIHIPDDLDDVVDDEEDDAWKQWGKPKPKDPPPFDPPSDITGMDPSQMQAEMLKRHFGPSFGFVKLRLGVTRTKEEVPMIAKKWTELLRTGSIEAKFMAVDVNTVMFTMEEGQDTAELKDFILSQPEAYEFKVGQQAYRRPGDPPLEVVVDKLNAKDVEANDHDTAKEWHHKEDEL